MNLKVCKKCGALVDVIKDCTCDNCGIRCCGEPMQDVNFNSSDGAVEKHKPVYEVVGNNIIVYVPHVMDVMHYIEFIELVAENVNEKVFFKAGDMPKAVFPYVRGSRVVAYCNKHGAWETEVI